MPVVLRQRTDRPTAEVRAGALAAVADEPRARDPQLPTAVEDRATATALVASPG